MLFMLLPQYATACIQWYVTITNVCCDCNDCLKVKKCFTSQTVKNDSLKFFWSYEILET